MTTKILIIQSSTTKPTIRQQLGKLSVESFILEAVGFSQGIDFLTEKFDILILDMNMLDRKRELLMKETRIKQPGIKVIPFYTGKRLASLHGRSFNH